MWLESKLVRRNLLLQSVPQRRTRDVQIGTGVQNVVSVLYLTAFFFNAIYLARRPTDWVGAQATYIVVQYYVNTASLGGVV